MYQTSFVSGKYLKTKESGWWAGWDEKERRWAGNLPPISIVGIWTKLKGKVFLCFYSFGLCGLGLKGRVWGLDRILSGVVEGGSVSGGEGWCGIRRFWSFAPE